MICQIIPLHQFVLSNKKIPSTTCRYRSSKNGWILSATTYCVISNAHTHIHTIHTQHLHTCVRIHIHYIRTHMHTYVCTDKTYIRTHIIYARDAHTHYKRPCKKHTYVQMSVNKKDGYKYHEICICEISTYIND